MSPPPPPKKKIWYARSYVQIFTNRNLSSTGLGMATYASSHLKYKKVDFTLSVLDIAIFEL